MNAFPPPLTELPETFAVFPLTGALLLPGGRLPLNIFEARYLAMTEDSLASGRTIGMVQPDPQKPSTETGPGLYRVGCLGRLSSFSETDDGRYLITLSGLIRFAVAEELPMRRGYRRIRADFREFLTDVDPAASGVLEIRRGELLDALRQYFARRGFDANWDAIEQMQDEALVTTLCMVCPFEPAEKQALLEAAGMAERARALMALLQIEAYGGFGDAADDETPPRRAS